MEDTPLGQPKTEGATVKNYPASTTPIGLDLGGPAPAEKIAVSILAEVISNRCGARLAVR